MTCGMIVQSDCVVYVGTEGYNLLRPIIDQAHTMFDKIGRDMETKHQEARKLLWAEAQNRTSAEKKQNQEALDVFNALNVFQRWWLKVRHNKEAPQEHNFVVRRGRDYYDHQVYVPMTKLEHTAHSLYNDVECAKSSLDIYSEHPEVFMWRDKGHKIERIVHGLRIHGYDVQDPTMS